MNLGQMNKLINELSDAPFKYGENDCYTFTTKLVKEWHGIDLTNIHAVYKSEKQANEYMEKFGGIEKLTIGTLGYSIDPLRCRDGDVVTAEIAPDQIALGFVFDGKGLFKGKRKRVYGIKLENCRKGWRIN